MIGIKMSFIFILHFVTIVNTPDEFYHHPKDVVLEFGIRI